MICTDLLSLVSVKLVRGGKKKRKTSLSPSEVVVDYVTNLCHAVNASLCERTAVGLYSAVKVCWHPSISVKDWSARSCTFLPVLIISVRKRDRAGNEELLCLFLQTDWTSTKVQCERGVESRAKPAIASCMITSFSSGSDRMSDVVTAGVTLCSGGDTDQSQLPPGSLHRPALLLMFTKFNRLAKTSLRGVQAQ